MNYKLIFSIAKSLLLARVKQTSVAAFGVTFSICMFITLLSFMTGLNNLLDGLILNRTPHVRLFNEIKPSEKQPVDMSSEFKNKHNFIRSIKSANSRVEIYDSEAIMKAVKNDKRTQGISPKIKTPVFFNDGSIDINGIINGIDVDAENKLFFFNDYIVQGYGTDLKNVSNSIVLGKGLADKLLVGIGDVAHVTTSKGEQVSLKVVGIFQSGLNDFDKSQSFTSLSTAQKLLGVGNNYITDIQIKLQDVNQAPIIAKEYAQLFQINAEDIQTANSQFETGTKVRTIISYSVGITLLIVAGFGIYNILNMMIYEKMESIAILKATGFSGKDVQLIFMTIALSIGILGGLLGLVLGFSLSSVIDQIPFNTAALPTVKTFPINYNPKFYFIGITFSTITTFLAGWLPSIKASRVDPVVIIRGK